jgi:hypothetical protein
MNISQVVKRSWLASTDGGSLSTVALLMYTTNEALKNQLRLLLTGRLNIDILEQTINAIIQRHESLRTTFPMVEGKPIQKIAPSLKIKLLVVNLKDVPQDKLDKQIIEELQKTFHFSSSCPDYDVTLFRFADYGNYISAQRSSIILLSMVGQRAFYLKNYLNFIKHFYPIQP